MEQKDLKGAICRDSRKVLSLLNELVEKVEVLKSVSLDEFNDRELKYELENRDFRVFSDYDEAEDYALVSQVS